MRSYLFGGSRHQYHPSVTPAFGTHIDNVICRFYDIEVMLDYQYGISFIDQTVQYPQQHTDIFKMETRSRFIENI